jgi:hypothetical protein
VKANVRNDSRLEEVDGTEELSSNSVSGLIKKVLEAYVFQLCYVYTSFYTASPVSVVRRNFQSSCPSKMHGMHNFHEQSFFFRPYVIMLSLPNSHFPTLFTQPPIIDIFNILKKQQTHERKGVGSRKRLYAHTVGVR